MLKGGPVRYGTGTWNFYKTVSHWSPFAVLFCENDNFTWDLDFLSFILRSKWLLNRNGKLSLWVTRSKSKSDIVIICCKTQKYYFIRVFAYSDNFDQSEQYHYIQVWLLIRRGRMSAVLNCRHNAVTCLKLVSNQTSATRTLFLLWFSQWWKINITEEKSTLDELAVCCVFEFLRKREN